MSNSLPGTTPIFRKEFTLEDLGRYMEHPEMCQADLQSQYSRYAAGLTKDEREFTEVRFIGSPAKVLAFCKLFRSLYPHCPINLAKTDVGKTERERADNRAKGVYRPDLIRAYVKVPSHLQVPEFTNGVVELESRQDVPVT